MISGRSIGHRSGIVVAAICFTMLMGFALISWFSWLHKCATFDEPLHFVGAWTQTHFADFRCNPEDPPLWKYYVAAGTNLQDMQVDRTSYLWNMMLKTAPSPAVHFVLETMYQTPGNDPDALFRAAHVRMVALGVVLGAVIAWWAWRLAGAVAALVACAAFCLDPNFLAHSPLVKNDVPITLVLFVLMAFIWMLGRRATLPRMAGVALLVGAAITTKFSGILAIPMLGIALLCRAMLPADWQFLKWNLSSRARRLVGAAGMFAISIVAAYVIIWACYDFRFGVSPNPAERLDYRSVITQYAQNQMLLRQDPVPAYPDDDLIERLIGEWQPDLLVQMVGVANQHHLLPQAWLYGFLYTYGSSLTRRSFFCGDIRIEGWWYYFPAAMAFKTPLATLVGLALAAVICLSLWRRKNIERHSWTVWAAVIGPVFYMIVAMRSHLNIGLRHIFPVYPFLFLFLGVMAARGFNRRPKLALWVILPLFAGLACETLCAFPNYIPFFNVAVGGSRGGLALLSDSNIDWGQDLPALVQWQQHNQKYQLNYCQFGLPDPRYYGLRCVDMKGSQVAEMIRTLPGGPPMYALSAVAMQGPYMDPDLLYYYRQFLKQQPVTVLNGAIYLYDRAPTQ